MRSKSETVKLTGVVEETLPSLLFKVRLDDNKEVLAHLGGKLKLHHIKVLLGDKVVVEMTSYDEKRGRIIRRL